MERFLVSIYRFDPFNIKWLYKNLRSVFMHLSHVTTFITNYVMIRSPTFSKVLKVKGSLCGSLIGIYRSPSWHLLAQIQQSKRQNNW